MNTELRFLSFPWMLSCVIPRCPEVDPGLWTENNCLKCPSCDLLEEKPEPVIPKTQCEHPWG